LDLKYPVHACHANESNQADNLYQILQSSASFPPEVYIAPAKSALLWETSSFDCSDEEIKVKISTILLKVNDEDEIYSVVQVDPNDTAIKEFIESDSTTAKKSAAMTAKISTTSEDEEEAAPVPRPKRKAETKEIEEKILKRTEVTRNKQAEKAMVESTEKGASKKARSRSRSKSIVEGKDGGNSTPTLKAPAARKESKDSIAESIASKGPQTTKKRKRQIRDPNSPRRPLTTFLLFCKDAREGIKKEHPDATVPEMGKILGAKYTELSGVEKEVYRSQAITLKKHFDLDKAQYLKDKDKEAQAEEDNTESLDSVEIESKPSSKKKHPKKRTITKETEDAEEIGDTVRSPTKAAIKVTKSEEEKRDPTKKTKKTRKKNKDPNAPKRPLTTYLLFCKEYREKVVKENPDKTTQEIGMILGATYRKLKTEERAKYQKDADKLKQQFLKDEENYETNTVEGGSDGGDKSDEEEEAPETVKKNKRAKKDPIAPKKAQSAYVLFCSSKRPKLKEEQPKLTVPETARIMGKMWQDTSAAMKAPFDVMAKKDKERYKSEMETFKASS
jgi:upstream-binding transcription factor